MGLKDIPDNVKHEGDQRLICQQHVDEFSIGSIVYCFGLELGSLDERHQHYGSLWIPEAIAYSSRDDVDHSACGADAGCSSGCHQNCLSFLEKER